jgi:hypothetical protein
MGFDQSRDTGQVANQTKTFLRIGEYWDPTVESCGVEFFLVSFFAFAHQLIVMFHYFDFFCFASKKNKKQQQQQQQQQ